MKNWRKTIREFNTETKLEAENGQVVLKTPDGEYSMSPEELMSMKSPEWDDDVIEIETPDMAGRSVDVPKEVVAQFLKKHGLAEAHSFKARNNSMKTITENWREYKQSEEFDAFIQEHFGGTIDEGFVDWVINKGKDIRDTVVGVIDGIKEWTHERIVSFVKHMAQKLEEFFAELRRKGALGKNDSRQEISAIKLLRTNKHIDLAVLILSTIAKMSGGFIVDKVIKLPAIIEKILDILDNPMAAAQELFGDAVDIYNMIKKFIEFRKDKKTLAAQLNVWDNFGGLAERST